MKVVLLAGGLGTRLSEETDLKPKPMVEIGGMPILWHIMKIYSSYGYHDFIVCLGYKGYIVKEYFANYFLHKSDVTIDLQDNSIKVHDSQAEPWKITLVNYHKEHGKYCTVTSVQPSGRFGALNILEDSTVHSFMEKPKGDGAWINGGFFVCEP